MTPRDRVLSKLRACWPGTASYKEIAAPLNHREDRDQVVDALKTLVAEGLIEVASVKHVTVLPRDGSMPVVGTRSRYRLLATDETFEEQP